MTEVFKAKAVSLHDLFNAKGNALSFRIPEYQRTYDWGVENLQRIFENVVSGLHDLPSDKDSLTFLGTLILVHDYQGHEDTFDGVSYAVVDGQQRLTTISLVSVHLREALEKAISNLEDLPEDLKVWLRDEEQYVVERLVNCVSGFLKPDGVDTHPFPRVVRHSDNRADTSVDSAYLSVISKYLNAYAKHIRERAPSPFSFDDWNDQIGTTKRFKENVKSIIGFINEVRTGKEKGDIGVDFPKTGDLKKSAVHSLFNRLPKDDSKRERMLSCATERYAEATAELFRLLTFSCYWLDHVLVIRVLINTQKYAVDIFDALNTTGEPLTAIETFKPRVIQFEDEQGRSGYAGSESEKFFGGIEKYIAQFSKKEERQNGARDLIVPFALYLTGEKISRDLNSQRRYLRKTYEEIEKEEARWKYVKHIADLANFKDQFWSKSNLEGALPGFGEREVVLMCLGFLREMKNSLTIPVLCRYYVHSLKEENQEIFRDAVLAMTAFVALRRAATGGTAGIDSDLRAIMSRGRPAKNSKSGLKVDLLSDRELPGTSEFKEYLREWLDRRPAYVSDWDTWISKAESQGMYSHSKPLCRFIIFLAAHNARPDSKAPWKLKKVRADEGLRYLDYRRWFAPEYKTVEHIAPKNDPERNWDKSIYTTPELKDSIGNLTLLPWELNSAVGNAPWEKKRLFYEAVAAKDDDDVQKVIHQADKQGISFDKKTKDLFRRKPRLPIIVTIAKQKEWNAKSIKSRTRNILELFWGEIWPWLEND